MLGADTTGPAVASRYNSIELGTFCLLPKRDRLVIRRPESTALLLLVWDTSCESILQSGEARELGGRAGGRLKPDVKVSNAGDRPPRLGRDVVTFEDMREFLVAYLEYEQQMHVANEDGGDRVLARRRDLVDSAT